jgi:opacity protein-like surface antigen
MKALRLLAPLLLLACLAAPAQAGFFQQWSLAAHGNQAFDLDGDQDLYGAGILVGLAAPLHASGQVRLDLRVEGQFGGFWDHGSGVEAAALPSLRLYFGQDIRPYLEAGVGPSYNSLDIEELGTGFNFLSFGGVGLCIPLREGMDLVVGYRIRHISNAGLDADHNSGISSHQFQAGLAFPF